MEGTKACTKCGEVKPLAEFYVDNATRDKRTRQCKDCMITASRKRYFSGLANQNKINNPIGTQLSSMLSNSKQRAKRNNLEHNIDLKYLRTIAPSHCPYLGIKLRWGELQIGTGVQPKASPDSPSLDRIDSSKGYVKGNVVIVSYRANTIKNNASELELIQMGRRIAHLKAHMAFPD